MEQNNNNSQNEFLWTLLANPADDARQYNYNLQRLVNDFPQSGILQALLAHSSDEKNLRQASVYFNAKALYKLINAPASFIGVPNEKIIVQNGSIPIHYNGYQQQDTNTGAVENYFSDNTQVETLTAADELPASEHEIVQQAEDGHRTAENAVNDVVTGVEHQAEDLIEEHAAPLHQHREEVENVVEEATASIATFHDTAPVEDATAHHNEEAHGNLQEEIKHEVAADAPLVEPIINYAFGMGHRLPPDAPGQEAVPFTAEEHTPPPIPEEHAIVEQVEELQVPAQLSEEHSVAEYLEEVPTPAHVQEAHAVAEHEEETHTPPPIPEEHLVIDHTGEAYVHPVVHEHDLVIDPAAPEMHTPPPVPHEHTFAEHASPEAHTPAPVPEEHKFADPVAAEYEGFNETEVEEHQHTEDNHRVEHTIEEPIQQYRPWDEPQPEQPHPVQHAPEAVAEPVVVESHLPEAVAEPVTTETHVPELKEEIAESHTIDDEVYDEISSIEPDILGNIAATNYFMFDRAFGEHKKPEPVNGATAASEPVTESAGDAEQQDVSKYHDEKMPYSFLWWLDKTRKEHSGVYQPYTAPAEASGTNTRAKLKPGTDELQQQYYENIFHITSVEELDKSVPQPPYAAQPAYENRKKEQVIMERFIQEEPQIRPQSSDKLDNENKAKKSSEDRDELVSETLAAIYSDQMLYHKAIASYKKLMLRFPEKSRYFAAKIEQLEKKTN